MVHGHADCMMRPERKDAGRHLSQSIAFRLTNDMTRRSSEIRP